MMGAITISAAEVQGLYALLTIIADPAKAKETLDALQAAQAELKAQQDQIAAATSEHGARATALDSREAEISRNESVAGAVVAASERSRLVAQAAQVAARAAQTRADQAAADVALREQKIKADTEALVARDAANVKEADRLSKVRAELERLAASLDTRRKNLQQALASVA